MEKNRRKKEKRDWDRQKLQLIYANLFLEKHKKNRINSK